MQKLDKYVASYSLTNKGTDNKTINYNTLMLNESLRFSLTIAAYRMLSYNQYYEFYSLHRMSLFFPLFLID